MTEDAPGGNAAVFFVGSMACLHEPLSSEFPLEVQDGMREDSFVICRRASLAWSPVGVMGRADGKIQAFQKPVLHLLDRFQMFLGLFASLANRPQNFDQPHHILNFQLPDPPLIHICT